MSSSRRQPHTDTQWEGRSDGHNGVLGGGKVWTERGHAHHHTLQEGGCMPLSTDCRHAPGPSHPARRSATLSFAGASALTAATRRWPPTTARISDNAFGGRTRALRATDCRLPPPRRPRRRRVATNIFLEGRDGVGGNDHQRGEPRHQTGLREVELARVSRLLCPPYSFSPPHKANGTGATRQPPPHARMPFRTRQRSMNTTMMVMILCRITCTPWASLRPPRAATLSHGSVT